MVRRQHAQRNIFEMILPDGEKLWDPALRRIDEVLERLVRLARQRKVVRGRKLRVDTTVVETNIHHPTDSTLLQDGVRVITRTLHKIRRRVGKLRFRDRTRSVSRRVFAIAVESRKLGRKDKRDLKNFTGNGWEPRAPWCARPPGRSDRRSGGRSARAPPRGAGGAGEARGAGA